jgi:hypothetical protein
VEVHSCPLPAARPVRTPAGSTSPSTNAFAGTPHLGGRSHHRDGGGGVRLMLHQPPGWVILVWRVPLPLGGAPGAGRRLRVGHSMISSGGAGPQL